jgi:hypothetical protein
MIARATALLPDGHGQVTVRGDSGFYSAELMMLLRAQQTRFSFSAPRTTRMWGAMAQIPADAWAQADGMRGAQVAETVFTPDGWRHEQLRLIVRRVSVSASDLLAGHARARRR